MTRKRYLLLAGDEAGAADEYDTLAEAVEAAELEVLLQRHDAAEDGGWPEDAGCVVVEVRREWELVEQADGSFDLAEVPVPEGPKP